MIEVNVHQAKTQLSALLRRAAAGEEVVIARAGKPVARLVPIEEPPRRLLGLDEGLFTVPEDFDAPLPDELLAEFERRSCSSTPTSGSGCRHRPHV